MPEPTQLRLQGEEDEETEEGEAEEDQEEEQEENGDQPATPWGTGQLRRPGWVKLENAEPCASGHMLGRIEEHCRLLRVCQFGG